MSAASRSLTENCIRALAPLIEACAAEAEQTRRLPSSLVEALAQAGLFRL